MRHQVVEDKSGGLESLVSSKDGLAALPPRMGPTGAGRVSPTRERVPDPFFFAIISPSPLSRGNNQIFLHCLRPARRMSDFARDQSKLLTRFAQRRWQVD